MNGLQFENEDDQIEVNETDPYKIVDGFRPWDEQATNTYVKML